MMAVMPEPIDPVALCRHWFAAEPLRVTPLSVTGFSGAEVFCVDRADTGERFVLKRFAASATPRHAAWVHALAGHLRGVGIDAVPRVCVVADRAAAATLVADRDGALWEMVEFKPGTPLEAPAVAAAAAAAAVLARVHRAAAVLPGSTATSAVSPGLARRIERCRALVADPWSRWLERRLERRTPARVAGIPASPGLVPAVRERLAAAATIVATGGIGRLIADVATMTPAPLPLQPVLRDVWCDHVLFSAPVGGPGGDAAAATAGPAGAGLRVVTGIIDLHAAGIDTPATDLARLLGSWTPPAGRRTGGLADRWPEPLAAYEEVRPLAPEERGVVDVLHAAGIVVSLDNWFRWTLEEGRCFPDSTRVLARIDRLLAALAAGAGAGGTDGRGD